MYQLIGSNINRKNTDSKYSVLLDELGFWTLGTDFYMFFLQSESENLIWNGKSDLFQKVDIGFFGIWYIQNVNIFNNIIYFIEMLILDIGQNGKTTISVGSLWKLFE